MEPKALKEFEAKVRNDFKGNGPYPTYSLPLPAPSPMPSTTPYNKPAPLYVPSIVSGHPSSKSPPEQAQSSPAPSPTYPNAYNLPTLPMSTSSPDMPEAYHPTSTSPASTVSPPTLPGYEDLTAKIVTPPGSLTSSYMESHHAAAGVASGNPGPSYVQAMHIQHSPPSYLSTPVDDPRYHVGY